MKHSAIDVRLAGVVALLGLAMGCTSKPGAEQASAQPAGAARSAAESPKAEVGTLSGRLAYPSEQTPPMTIYVLDASGDPETRFLRTTWNQRRYQIDLPPGRYFVFAIPDERVDPLVVGAHTDYSPCNARSLRGEEPAEPCQTSPPREVIVRAGAVTDDADIDDWYLTDDIAANLNALAAGARERAGMPN